MGMAESKAPISLPRCPICQSQAILLEITDKNGIAIEWAITCETDGHIIQIYKSIKAEAMEAWKKAFGKSEPKPKTEEEIFKALKFFQAIHGYALHPTLGKTKMSLRSWSKLIAEIGRCPCDSKRLSCPCSQVVDEVNSQGHCHCRLFWDDRCEEYKNWGK